ncbi:YezD family protein [Luteolibacter pohnpeiensis]|uniref:YezD family protein n=1 Tax=Luteolibacter pohnpeiensis TaxID=454153 RepID=A0A934S877_9BACT|nr:YezD family protein [Luteolibacter pohnpeiensis]MBK1881487.1 YezD family protein [Luteolibacter pohnpeiensis]
MTSTNSDTPRPDRIQAEWLEVVCTKVANLRFGSVQITVHDGRVTQIESIEKTRFVADREEAPSKPRS